MVASYSASISFVGRPIKLTIIVTIRLKEKPGTISYSSKMRPERKSPQMMTVSARTINPATAPLLLILLQNSASTILGTKEEPSPAQAYSTSSSTPISGSVAISTATNAMSNVAIRPTQTNSFADSSFLNNARYISSATAEDETSNWESIVLIMADKIPANKIPATIG